MIPGVKIAIFAEIIHDRSINNLFVYYLTMKITQIDS